MRCRRWTQMAFPYVEGALAPEEHREYSGHLAGCPECRAELVQSRAVNEYLRTLPDPDLTAADARAFDQSVLRQLGLGHVAAPAAVRSAPIGVVAVPATYLQRPGAGSRFAARQSAARAISVAARSRLSQRRFEPMFAPIRSLLLVSLGLAVGSVAGAVLFGEMMMRALGGGLTVAASSVWTRAAWITEAALERVVELTTVLGVAQGMLTHTRPWLLALQTWGVAHGRELALLLGVMLTLTLIAGAAWQLRRVRRARSRVS